MRKGKRSLSAFLVLILVISPLITPYKSVSAAPGVNEALTKYHQGENVIIRDLFAELSLAEVFVEFIESLPTSDVELTVDDEINKVMVSDAVETRNSVDTFNASNKGITNLEGIQVFEGMDTSRIAFNFSGNIISDLSPLSWVISAHSLSFEGNNLSNVDGLINVKKLGQAESFPNSYLDLDSNPLQNINGLQNLIRAKDIHITNTSLGNLDGLNNLISAVNVHLNNNRLTNVDGLSSLQSVGNIMLHNNEITNLYGLQSLKEVSNDLWLSNNLLTDLNGLENLTKVGNQFYVNNNNLVNVNGLSSLESVVYLHLNDNELVDVTGLSNLNSTYNEAEDPHFPSIKELFLQNNKLSNIDGLGKIESVHSLNASNNEISDLSGLSNLKFATYLELDNNQLSNLNPLINLNHIRVLSANNNVLSNIEGLKNLIYQPYPLSTSIKLDDNELTNLDILESATVLHSLSVSNNKLVDIDGLRNIDTINSLSLDGNQLTDVDPLENITKLTELYLQNNKLYNVNGLRNLVEVYNDISIENNRITDISTLNPELTITSRLGELVLRSNYINLWDTPNKEVLEKHREKIEVGSWPEFTTTQFRLSVKEAGDFSSSPLESLIVKPGEIIELYYPKFVGKDGKSFDGFSLPNPNVQYSLGELSFKTSDSSVAYINSDGNLVGVNDGNAQITTVLWNIDDKDYTTYSYEVMVKTQTPEVTLSNLVVSPKTATIYVGEDQQYIATAYYSDGTQKDVTNESLWSVDHTNIADISSGKAKGKIEGTAQIEATYQGLSDNAELIVKEKEPSLVGLKVTPETATVKVGESQQYTATAIFSDGSNKNVTNESIWSISKTEIATIDENGLSTGITEGQTTVTARYNGLSDDAALIVEEEYTPPPVELIGLEVTPKTATILIGETQDYAAIAYYSDGTQKNVSDMSQWNVVNRGIAEAINGESITTHAIFLGKNEGKTQITATFEGLTDNAELIVKPLPKPPVTLKSIEIIPKSATIYIGDNQQYIAIATYSNGSKEDVTNQSFWKVLENTIASIDNQGQATGKEVGKTDITAEFNGMTDTAELNVIKKEPVLVSLEVTPKKAEIYVDETQQYKATAYYDDRSTKDVTFQSIWTIEDSDIASINNGLAEGRNEGKVRVTATFDGLDDDAQLIVKAIEKPIPKDPEVPIVPEEPKFPEEPEVPKEVPNEPTPEEPIPNVPNKEVPGVPKTGDGSTVGKYNKNYVILLSIAALISVAIFRRKVTE